MKGVSGFGTDYSFLIPHSHPSHLLPVTSHVLPSQWPSQDELIRTWLTGIAS